MGRMRAAGERLAGVVRESVALIRELVDGGNQAPEILAFADRAVNAKAIVESITWRIRDPGDLDLWITATRDALNFLESHKDPKEDVAGAFQVEAFVGEITRSFQNYQLWESDKKVPWTLDQWLGSFEGAAAVLESNLASGFECMVSGTSKRHREWAGRMLKETDAVPKDMSKRRFETQDVSGYARIIRAKAHEGRPDAQQRTSA